MAQTQSAQIPTEVAEIVLSSSTPNKASVTPAIHQESKTSHPCHLTAQKMESLPVALEHATSSLLALPLELQLEIISLLAHDEYPSLACLRRTHSHFLALIPKAQIRSGLSRTEVCSQLRKTELEYGYLLPPEHYPCYFCARVLPHEALTGILVWGRPHIVDGERRGQFGNRCCKDCYGLEDGSYTTSWKKSLLWMESTLCNLPRPPLTPQLNSNDQTMAVSVTEKVEQQNSQDAQVHSSGFTGHEGIRNLEIISELTAGHEEIRKLESIPELTVQFVFRRPPNRSWPMLRIAQSPHFSEGNSRVVFRDLKEA